MGISITFRVWLRPVEPIQPPVAQSVMYTKIADQLRDMLFKGIGTSEAVAANPTKAYDAKMGDPKQFVTLAFESLWGHLTPDA